MEVQPAVEGVHFRFKGVQYILVFPFNYHAGTGGYYFLWELS